MEKSRLKISKAALPLELEDELELEEFELELEELELELDEVELELEEPELDDGLGLGVPLPPHPTHSAVKSTVLPDNVSLFMINFHFESVMIIS